MARQPKLGINAPNNMTSDLAHRMLAGTIIAAMVIVWLIRG